MAVWPPATHADATAAIQELRTEPSLIPIARWLPSNYVAGTTDIGQYVQAAVDASEPTGNCQFVLPAGTHLWNTPVYLDAAIRDLSYSFIGHGKGTYITLGSGLNGQYALHNNENASGVVGIASPGHPRLTIADMTIDGNGAGTKGMVFSNAANVRSYNIKTIDVYRLVQTTGYCDNMEFRKIRVQVPNATGAVMYWNKGSGDGLIIEQISAGDDTVVCDLAGCNGATISSGIVGVYKFTSCESISVVSFHNDGGNTVSYQASPSFIINSSRVNFLGGWDQIGMTAPVIQINDTLTTGYSEVLIQGWNFDFRPHSADKVRSPHVQVLAAQPATKVRFRGCGSDFEPENTPNRYPAGPTFSATDSNIQAAFDAWPTAMLEDTDLVQTDIGWQFLAAGIGGRPYKRIATTPTVTAAAGTLAPGNHSAGTKFYKVAVYTDKTRSLHTAASTEASIAISGTQAAQLTVTTRATPALVRVWRGTATGVYTAYVDVPVSGFSALLFDTGTALNGIAWVATSVPTPPTVNTTLDGLTLGRLADFHGPAFPTEGTWSVGDRVTNSAPAASGTIGWVCTTAGTPGTWKTYGAISP